MEDLRPETKTFLLTCQQYLKCREQMDAKYLEVDELQIIAKLKVTADSEGIITDLSEDGRLVEEYKAQYQQQSTSGSPVQTLNQLYEAAMIVEPIYKNMVKNLIQASCDACNESVDTVEVLFPGLKGRDRSLEKANDDYSKRLPGPGISWIYDIVRGSIQFSSAEQVAKCLELLKEDKSLHIVTVRNRFTEPTLTGYRDVKVCIQLESGQGFKHICELQIHHKAIKALDTELDSHSQYEYFRKYFAGGNGCLKERLEDLAMISGGSTFNDSLLTSILTKDSSEERLDRLGNLFLHQLCEYDWALRTFRKLLQLQLSKGLEETLPVATTYRRIGTVLSTQSQREEAIVMFQESARIMENILGPYHEKVAQVCTEIGHVLRNQGEWDEAIGMFEKSIDIISKRAQDTKNQMMIADAYHNMGKTLKDQGKLEKAVEVLQISLQTKKACLGEEHSSLADTYLYLGKTYNDLGNRHENKDFMSKAMKQYQESLAIYKKTSGERHYGVAQTYYSIALLFADQGMTDMAIQNFELSLELYTALFGEEHRYVTVIYQNLAALGSRRSYHLPGASFIWSQK